MTPDQSASEIRRLEANLKLAHAKIRQLSSITLWAFKAYRALLFYGTRQHQRHNWIEDGDTAREIIEDMPEGFEIGHH